MRQEVKVGRLDIPQSRPGPGVGDACLRGSTCERHAHLLAAFELEVETLEHRRCVIGVPVRMHDRAAWLHSVVTQCSAARRDTPGTSDTAIASS